MGEELCRFKSSNLSRRHRIRSDQGLLLSLYTISLGTDLDLFIACHGNGCCLSIRFYFCPVNDILFAILYHRLTTNNCVLLSHSVFFLFAFI
jgi:hypothetical protein